MNNGTGDDRSYLLHLDSSFFNMTVVISRPLFGFVSFLSTSLVTTDKFTSLQIIGIRREEKRYHNMYTKLQQTELTERLILPSTEYIYSVHAVYVPYCGIYKHMYVYCEIHKHMCTVTKATRQ